MKNLRVFKECPPSDLEKKNQIQGIQVFHLACEETKTQGRSSKNSVRLKSFSLVTCLYIFRPLRSVLK